MLLCGERLPDHTFVLCVVPSDGYKYTGLTDMMYRELLSVNQLIIFIEYQDQSMCIYELYYHCI